jgi:hypothetical protein
MIRALRRARARFSREGKTRQYLRYAAGELILVVIGILIALQLNSANQERQSKKRLHESAAALLSDLQADLLMLIPIQREMENVRERVNGLGEYVRSRPIEDLDNLNLYFYMRAPFYRPYAWNRSAIDQMRVSGQLQRMENRALAARITNYQALQAHLLDDYVHDREIAVRALALAGKVVDMNYPPLEDFVDVDQLQSGASIISLGSSLNDSEIHSAFLQLDLDLLDRDPVRLGEAVNAYMQIRNAYGLWPRFVIELPRLQQDIRDLMQALMEEFDLPKPRLTARQ